MDKHLRSSTSSLYVTDEEEDMDIGREEGAKRKRRLSGRSQEEKSTGLESEEPAKIRKCESKKKEERVAQVTRVIKRRMQEEEESERERNEKEEEEMRERALKEQRRVREEKGKKESTDVIGRVQAATKAIMEAIDRENGGKISFTRGDQSAIRRAVWMVQNEMIELLKRTMESEERRRQAEEEVKKCREEMKKGRKEEKDARTEISVRESSRTAQRREVAEEDSKGTENWVEGRVRRRRRTYAQVSAGVNGETLKGRRVVPGEEGWKTPPPKPKKGERALIVSSKEEGDARKLADSLARNVTVEELGGAPQMVRKVRDGKVVIVPKDGAQKERMVDALKRVKGVEVKESRPAEPFLVVTGVARGMTDEELITKMTRGLGMSEGVEGGIRIVRRLRCQNNWKENVVIRTGIEVFKTMVKRGKVEIDCSLYFVEEYLGLAMCFRCCRFGHIMKTCREPETCHKCGGGARW